MSGMQSDSDIIYLDHAAATPVDEAVLAAMQPYQAKLFYNPSSPYLPAFQVHQDYEAARARLAHAIGARPAEVVITAGATESINLAFASAGGHVVASSIEHASVLACAQERNHTLAPVDERGLVDPADVEAAIRPDTQLVSIGLANNEIGTVQPLRRIAAMVAQVRQQRLAQGDATPLYLHTDASQCAGQIDVNTSTLGIDMLTLNAAKVYGPKQVGLLWCKSHVQLSPILAGGGQERGLRSGTQNVAGAIGFACALSMAVEGRKAEAERLSKLRDALQRELVEAFPQAVVSGHKRHRLPGYLHISFPGLDAERLVYLLEEKGVLVGTGAACAANKATRSHVLEAIGLPPEVADGSLRLTLGRLSTEENTAQAAKLIAGAVRAEYERTSS